MAVAAPALAEEADDQQLKGNIIHYGDNPHVDNLAHRSRKSRHLGPPPKEIAELMERVIRERGEPMSRGEIVEALERRDVEIPAQDKARYVGTLAWRKKGTFMNIEGRGYWLRNAGIPKLSGDPIDTPNYHSLPEENGEDGLFD